ncbi:ParB/RepB/Spo0J family partition protein [Fusibacter bizertensis]|uniref:ParB/RepB/Spo0J family partition protein n=1 Tax=Fusibacter bizertensis TaxID=1488331 RepID=A0ABT6NFP0_9FIRM|nr:ParB/RepB/Spo0J family partition protein [Fusibacter bizertensis]MDH8679183.1 ParB/RepB/Spo0J family partition protein [Fusibacter bizertensis]
MSVKKSGLGRGLGALINNESMEAFENKVNDHGELIHEIDINLIMPNKNQPRKNFDHEKIISLSESIEDHGLMQPIVLKSKGGLYEIIAGERRWRACKHLGLKKVPSIIKDVDESTIAQLALIENLQREDLNAIEEAMAYSRLIDEYQITQEKMSKIAGKSRVYITNTMRLLKLDDYIQAAIAEKVITSGHGRALLGLDNEKKRRKAYDLVLADELSVRATEELIKNYDKHFKSVESKAKPIRDAELVSIEEDLSVYVGTKVSIKEKNGRGKIVIDFYNEEDLSRILDLIK